MLRAELSSEREQCSKLERLEGERRDHMDEVHDLTEQLAAARQQARDSSTQCQQVTNSLTFEHGQSVGCNTAT